LRSEGSKIYAFAVNAVIIVMIGRTMAVDDDDDNNNNTVKPFVRVEVW
jgi:hypothetical protein